MLIIVNISFLFLLFLILILCFLDCIQTAATTTLQGCSRIPLRLFFGHFTGDLILPNLRLRKGELAALITMQKDLALIPERHLGSSETVNRGIRQHGVTFGVGRRATG